MISRQKYRPNTMIKNDGKWMTIPMARKIWTDLFGPIPDGFFVLHLCDELKCINPSHLWLGTQKDNMRDMIQKKRHPGNRLVGFRSAYGPEGTVGQRIRLQRFNPRYWNVYVE